MGSDWGSVKLGDFCSKIGSGSTPRGGSSVYLEDGEYALFRSQNILNNAFSKNGLVFIDTEAAKKLQNVSIEEHDVLLNITGDSVARVCKAPSEYLPARVNQHVAIIRTKQDELNSSYINYYLNSRSMQNYMLSIASAGATRNALTKIMIENFDIPKPPIGIQKKIAHILSTLDDKIELNRKMNQTLEEIAQALFKSWFVDFDPVHLKAMCTSKEELEAGAKELGLSKEVLELFPDELMETEMGMIPLGWEVKKLGDYFPVVTGKKNANIATEDGEYIFFTCSQNASRTDHYSFDAPAILLAGNGDFNVKWYRGKFEAYQRTYVLIPKNENHLSFLYTLMAYFLNDITQASQGSVIKFITKGMIENYKVMVPNDNELLKIIYIFTDINFTIEANTKQMNTLIETRDTMLPKLLSGEVDVSEVQI